ncbi:beta-galactosidase trimerization domain-containing protein [Paenibacillus sp. IB182496]|uniref:Beta-galactosidase trimerization domain-containing protein n=1 Tax=Paenibacillus sabuli TaxID=2772509 RepID=A0A927BP47_9BACL|nr:beta-galactosidase trimerization domain-containing protein [Paenibacillus sabuli]MBD2844136.1 beta-galactosidase trimerization domain-containing protein [Paenibacillus sabuli]
MQRTIVKGKNNEEQWWFKRPWRQLQTNLREIDWLDIDAERIVADLKSFKATSVLINSSGIVANYPTTHPYHFQNPYLQGDSLETIIEACHRADIAVLARTDFSKVRRPIYELHPEWAYISNEGSIVDYNGDVHVCFNSQYQQRHAFEIMKETLDLLDFDGIFFNAGGYQTIDYSNNHHGICQCDNCRTRFAAMYALDLPLVEDMNDPVYRKYLLFKQETSRVYERQVYDFVSGIRTNILVANNKAQGALTRGESHAEIYLPLPNWQYSGSDNTKHAKASHYPMLSVNSSADFVGIEYRHVAVSPHQQSLRQAQNLANGGGMCYYIIGRVDNKADRSAYDSIKQWYHYHAAHEQEYANLTSKADIAILMNNPHPRTNAEWEYQGWFRFLAENHYLFDSFSKGAAETVPFDRYKAVIVHEYEQLGDALCRKLDEFAQSGGTVIAVSKAGFRGDDLELREQPALECLGITRYKQVRTGMVAAYLKVDRKDAFPRFHDNDLCYVHGTYVYADYNERVEKYLKLIPPHHYGPPERCYYTIETDHPGVTVHAYGKGKGIYFPWEPGKQFTAHGHTNTIRLVADVLEELAGLDPVRGNLSPMVEVTLHRNEDDGSDLLHLVNGSGHFGTSYYAPITMHDLELTLPVEGGVREARSLMTGEAYPVEEENDSMIRIRIPRLEQLEAVKIVYGQATS